MFKCNSCKEQFVRVDIDLEILLLSDLKYCMLCNSKNIQIGMNCSFCKKFKTTDKLQQFNDNGQKKIICNCCKLNYKLN